MFRLICLICTFLEVVRILSSEKPRRGQAYLSVLWNLETFRVFVVIRETFLLSGLPVPVLFSCVISNLHLRLLEKGEESA